MTARAALAAALLGAIAAGCGGGSTSVTTGATQNSPAATITVMTAETFPNGNVVQVPAIGVTVTLSTGVSGTTPTGVRATAVTNGSGAATFTGLPANGQLCASAATTSLFAAHCPSPFPGAVTLDLSTVNQVPGTPQPGQNPP